MKKLIIVLAVVFLIGIGFHIHRRYSAHFFYVDGNISAYAPWKFNEERYELVEDGFRVERGNFLWYTEELFEHGYYAYKLRIMGFPVKYRKVDYAHNYCWGFPGIPGVEWFKGWPHKGKKRFKQCLPIVELYREQYQRK